jgi:hypothetical protein
MFRHAAIIGMGTAALLFASAFHTAAQEQLRPAAPAAITGPSSPSPQTASIRIVTNSMSRLAIGF